MDPAHTGELHTGDNEFALIFSGHQDQKLERRRCGFELSVTILMKPVAVRMML